MAQGTVEARPKLSGTYWEWLAEGVDPLVTQPIGSIVAVVGTHDWGAVNAPTFVSSNDDFITKFGPTVDDLSRAVYGAFKGEGWGGKAGASGLVVVRQAAAAAAAATRALNNTTPGAAITLTAKHPGTRGNSFRAQVQAHTVVGQNELLIYDGTQIVERYPHVAADIAELVADINDASDYVTATMLIDNVALVVAAAANFAGGNDGTTLTGTEWTATMASLDNERWSIFSPANLTDATIRGSVVSWIQSRNLLGRRSMAVLGGAIDENAGTANTRSAAINHWDIVNVGVGRLRLGDLGDVEVSTAQFASRVAGSIAFRGEAKDMVYVRYRDVELVTGPTLADQELCFDAGTTCLTRDTDLNAPVHIRDGVTTYSDDTASPVDDQNFKTRPVAWYSRIKNVRIQHGVELEVDEWATSGDVLGDLPNDERSPSIIKGRYETAYQRREDASIVQPGWSVALLEGDLDDDFVQVKHGFHPTRSIRQMFNIARIG